MNQQKAVLVLGMHRSGTSALTGVLGFLGVDLGTQLMPAAPGENPKGFFEHLPVYEVNEKILKSLHKAWWSLGEVNPHQANELQQLQREGRDLIRRDFERSPIFAFKDPRNARLLPFWLSVLEQLEIEVVTLLSIRSPHAVYKSLFKRNDFSRLKSYILWAQHYLGILRALKTVDLVVHYDELVEEPAACLLAIGELLGRVPDGQALEEVSHAFIDPELRHARGESPSPDRLALVNHAQALYSVIRDFHLRSTTTDIFSQACLELRDDLEPYESLLDEYDRWGTELVNVRANHEQLLARTRELESRYDDKTREAATLISQHTLLASQVVPLQQELTSSLCRHGELQSQLTHAQAQLADGRSQLAESQSQLADVRSQLVDARLQLERTQLQLAETSSQRTEIETQLVDTQSQLAQAESRAVSQAAQADTERAQLESQVIHTAARLADAHAELARTQSQMAHAESRLAAFEHQLAQAQSHLVLAEAHRAQTDARLATSENELQLSRNHIVNIETVVGILRDEIRVSQAETVRLRATEARLGHRWANGAYGFLERHPRLMRALNAFR